MWEFYTKMVKCEVKVTCSWKDEEEDRFYVRSIEFVMEDMKGKPLLEKHAAIVLLNAIENGERKKK
ncbi:F-box family protein [Trifolium medium]|uniref:F-box family protein n=1 Tax=Trifolium medium TaxID=97028 RepID=A0A392SMV7_9FABA|nr:F-box family protein [Trifolium medium]